IPVNSSDAITGHKLQGLTKDSLVMYEWDSDTCWIYDVLSRVITLKGLYLIRPIRKSDIKAESKEYLEFMGAHGNIGKSRNRQAQVDVVSWVDDSQAGPSGREKLGLRLIGRPIGHGQLGLRLIGSHKLADPQVSPLRIFTRPRKTCGSTDRRAGRVAESNNNNDADGDSAEPPGPERSGGQATKTGKGRRVDGAVAKQCLSGYKAGWIPRNSSVVAKGEEIYNQSFDAFDEDLSTELVARRTKPCYFGAGDCQGTCLHASKFDIKKKNPSSVDEDT
ncbi:hypothetical protein THAOC_08714, partial [Thalassiosira oceanica]